MRLNRVSFQKIIVFILIVALVLAPSITASAQETAVEESIGGIPVSSGDTEGNQSVTTRFYEVNSQRMISFSVPYSDSFFERDDAVFYQDLAQASFGMTASAFRTGTDADAEPDTNIYNFFTEAGFENIQSFGYDVEPMEDSFANVIANKKIGDTTVVAFIGCGAGYDIEWISNLTVGGGDQHEGFTAAATLCEERLMNYLNQNEISGDVRLWISGYSRASAVDNLLAAHLVEEGLFSAVYAYFFATPNNTPSPFAYNNIFNIIGQNDPVTQAPPTSWGYGRYGRDLYTPAQEYNSDYISAAIEADSIMHEVSGLSFHNNPDLNRQYHVILEYLCDIFPTTEDYVDILQTQLISAYRDHRGQNLLVLLREALYNVDGFKFEQRSAVTAFINYLDEVIYQYIRGNEQQKTDGSWSSDITIGDNVLLEHLPATYLSWIFSTDDPMELYTDSTETVRLVISGTLDLEIWDDDGIIESISSDSEESIYIPGGEVRPEDAEFVYLYEANQGGRAVVNLPCDHDYTVKLNFLKSGTVSLFSEQYSYGDMTNNVSDLIVFSADKGDTVILQDFLDPDGMQLLWGDGYTVHAISQTLSSDTQSLIARESLMKKNSYTVRDLFILVLVVTVLPLLLLLLILIIFLRARKEGKGRNAITVCLGGISLVYAVGTVIYIRILGNVISGVIILGVLAVIFGLIVLLRILSKIVGIKKEI